MAKYLKHDSEKGFVEDYVEIQSLKFDNARHAVLGNMLGDFDEQGFYRVSPEIVEELIAMPKYVIEVMDNLEICLSTLKLDKQISFLIAYEGEKTTLSLIEKVNFEANNKLDSGTWSNVNEYVLDVVETSGEIDRQALYIKWNVQTFPGNIIDIFNCEDSVLAKYFNIVTRFKYNLEANNILLEKEEQLEEVESQYTIDLFEILTSYPELKKVVEKQLKQTLTEKKHFVKMDKPNFSKTLNEVLNKIVDENVGVLPENQKENFLQDKRNINIKANLNKNDVLLIDNEKISKSETTKLIEENQENFSNIINDDKNEIILPKIQTADVKYKSVDSIVQEYANIQSKVKNKNEEEAVSILIGKSKSKKSEVAKILVGVGIGEEIIVSENIYKLAESQKPKTIIEKNIKTTANVAEKKPEAKKEEKKDDKKKDKKDDKKKDKKKDDKKKDSEKKEEKKTSSPGGGFYSDKKVESKNNNKEDNKSTKQNIDAIVDAENSKTKPDSKNTKGMIGQRVGNNKDNKETEMSAEQIAKILEQRNKNRNVETEVSATSSNKKPQITEARTKTENIEQVLM